LPTIGHRIARVDHQVEQSTFELSAVDPGRPWVFRMAHLQCDARPQGTRHHVLQRVDQRADVHAARLQVLAAGEGEQALRQCRSPL